MYALGAESLGRKFPDTKLAKIGLIVRGLSYMRWMALTGGLYKSDDRASEVEGILAEAIGQAAEIIFREKQDALGFISVSLMMLMSTSRPTVKMVRAK
jgi:hypothetical protein